MKSTAPDINDVIVSKNTDGHLLYIVTPRSDERLSLLFRGDGWNLPYAVARGATLAGRRGGNLWYTSDRIATIEPIDTFRARRNELSG